MPAKIRYSSVVAFLVISLFVLSGCSRHPAQPVQAVNTADQASANGQPAQDQANADNRSDAGANSAPTLANSTQSNPVAAQGGNAAANGGTNYPPQNYPPQNGAGSGANNAAAQPLIIAAGTPVVVRLQQSLSSASSVPGQRFEAVLDQPLFAENENQIIAPVGTVVTGHVVVARRSGRFHHPGEIGLTLDTVILGQQSVPLKTSNVIARGGSHKKRNWGLIGGGTGGGALIGALAAGGKGALIGGGIGAAAGTTTALLTGKKDVGFGAERRLTFRLHRDVNLQT